ncbi:biotin-dependent carboxyltransferase family protein [Lysobacter sp. D1-1-M9]|uniref:5-oxoprolinase subunit C family protein n=1 Tax=Novilysobacter longmucuonensis TaxID=3098603 RepID=UPI0039836B0A
MSLHVLSPGPLTTVQDLGRTGWRHLGVARAGALDPGAAMLANRLVGNRIDAAVLELTLSGPTLRLERPVRVALHGAPVDARFEPIDGPRCAVPGGRPLTLPAGVLQLKALRDGARAWLAVAGGLDVPRVLGSRSTDLRGGFGGLDGRALRQGDTLALLAAPSLDVARPEIARWWVDPPTRRAGSPIIRYVPSSHPCAPVLARTLWQASPDSNRQGLRLDGACVPGAAPDANAGEQVSAAVAPGTIQLPPDGQPIVLLADAQTVGGYPRLGHVIAVDLPVLAQIRPGEALRFAPCDPTTAGQLACESRARAARLELMLASRA